ncbi:MAG: FAD-dependent oxidoreductase [Opitutaceae bacterium]
MGAGNRIAATWIERFGCTSRYRRFRDGVRGYYRAHYPLRPEHRADPRLNPGNGWVSPLCHEPRVALAVLQALLAPHVSARRIRILTGHVPSAVELDGADRIEALIVSETASGAGRRLCGRYFLDATENGDLLPLAKVEHVTGSEARTDTGEPGAGAERRPDNVQAFSMCFVLEEGPDESGVIAPPERWTFWRDYVPRLNPPWPGRLLGWEGLNPRTMERMRYHFDPHREKPGLFSGLRAFRRIIDRAQFTDGAYASDICLVNWPMIDYLEGDLLGCDTAERARRIADARELSLSMVYWLHPVEWNIGESAALLAAWCLRHDTTPQRVAADEAVVRRFQAELDRQGIELAWPEDLALEDGDPHAHARWDDSPQACAAAAGAGEQARDSSG